MLGKIPDVIVNIFRYCWYLEFTVMVFIKWSSLSNDLQYSFETKFSLRYIDLRHLNF